MKLPLFLQKDKWAHVTTLQVDAWSRDGRKTHGYVYMHLYESLKGKRKVRFTSTFGELSLSSEELTMFSTATEIYQTRVIRWLSGRYDPEIHRYSEIQEEDTLNALRGKVG